jgi:hypothetical protein
MATLIEVNVDQGGLLARNQQETTARRQAWLEQNSYKAAQAEGKGKRDERLAAEGRNPDGSLRPSGNANLSYRKQQPAANRQLVANVLLEPYTGSFTYNSSTYFLVDDFVKRKRVLPSSGQGPSDGIFAVATDYAVSFPNPLRSTTTFALGLGPQGSNAVRMEAFTPWGGGYGTAVTGCRVTSGSPPGPGVLNPGETYDSIVVFDPFLDALGYDSTYTRYGWPNCDLVTTQVYQDAYRADCELSFDYFFSNGTEFYRRAGTEPDRQTWEVYLKTDSPCDCYLELLIGGLRVYLYPESEYSELERLRDNNGAYNPQVYPLSISTSTFTQWTHVAAVTDSDFRLYIGGQLVLTIPECQNLYLDDASVFFQQYFYNEYSGQPSMFGANVTSTLYVHGLRISRKTRYTGSSFTPPPVIK